MPVLPDRPIAIYHEHPDWFRPLFAELERRGTPFVRLDANRHRYDAAAPRPPYALVFNRMSPSAWTRGHGHGIFYTLQYLEHLERLGVRVVNGAEAFSHRDLQGKAALVARAPRAPVSPRARHPRCITCTGRGAGSAISDRGEAEHRRQWRRGSPLRHAGGRARRRRGRRLEPGNRQHRTGAGVRARRGGRIVRVEVLGGKYLYAIRVYTTGESFDLCPADICRGLDGAELERNACPADAPKNGLRVENYQPPAAIVADVERIMDAAGIDVGGVEYVVGRARRPASVLRRQRALQLRGRLAARRRVRRSHPARGMARAGGEPVMRFGYWLPVFGGWLRNVPEEGMEASWPYVRRLAQQSEQLGFDLTLIAELNLNDIKGVDAPSLDAWSTAGALAAVTERLEIMIAVRPTFHPPALLAKQAASLDQLSGGRVSLNVVSSWWEDEARQYGVAFDEHDARYARTAEWLAVVNGMWTEARVQLRGPLLPVENAVLEPKPRSLATPDAVRGR
jgi:hypothetical protein